jgi:hypothetical protein
VPSSAAARPPSTPDPPHSLHGGSSLGNHTLSQVSITFCRSVGFFTALPMSTMSSSSSRSTREPVPDPNTPHARSDGSTFPPDDPSML